jgi:carbonic anhydrase
MRFLKHLFEKNRRWSERRKAEDPEFFLKLVRQQSPEYLWIGCSDSRVPANEIVDLLPGELFVHRNVANIMVHTDLNCLSVMQYAIDVLKVKHVIVCGHYGCGGVQAAWLNQKVGLVDNWLRHVQDVARKHRTAIEKFEKGAHVAKLCELNVLEQVHNVTETTIVQDAWARGQSLAIHGWVYGLHDGHLHSLQESVAAPDEVIPAYNAAVAAVLDGKNFEKFQFQMPL